MQYITHRRFRGKSMCGEVNIPAMTFCEEEDNVGVEILTDNIGE